MSNSIGDLRNSGLQGNNWPWQYKVLLGLDGIINALNNNGEDIETAYVVEKCPGPPPTERVLLEVRIWDTVTNTWGTIRYYVPGSNTPVPAPVPAPGCTLEYVDASNIRPLTCTDEITVCGTSFTTILGNSALNVNVVNPIPLEVLINQANDSILVYGFDGAANQPISVTSGGAVNIRPLTCTDVVSLCFDNAGTPTQVSDTNPLPVNAIVTVPSALDTALFAFDITSGVNEALTTTETSPGTHALDVNLTTRLDCTTDNVAICDGAGNALAIDSYGSINSNLYAIDSLSGVPTFVTLTGLGTANALDVYLQGPRGVQANCADAISTALCQTQENILTDIKTAVQGTLAANTDGVGIFGTEDGVNWNAVEVDSNGHVTTNATIVGPIGSQACTTSVSVALCTDQANNLADIKTAVQPITTITPNIQISSGDAATPIAIAIYSVTFFNNGSVDVLVSFSGGGVGTYVNIPAGTSISMDAGGINNQYPANTFYYDTVTVDPSGSLIVTYNS